MDTHVENELVDPSSTTFASSSEGAVGDSETEWVFDGTLDELNGYVNLDDWEGCV